MLWLAGDVKEPHAYRKELGMKFPVLWSGLCFSSEGWKCSEILATIKLLYNPRVNIVFTFTFTFTATTTRHSYSVRFFRLLCSQTGRIRRNFNCSNCENQRIIRLLKPVTLHLERATMSPPGNCRRIREGYGLV